MTTDSTSTDEATRRDASACNEVLGRGERMGRMFIAKRPCGKVVAAAWDVPTLKTDNSKSVARWVRAGLDIETVERYRNDPPPDWVCMSHEPCKCRENGAA